MVFMVIIQKTLKLRGIMDHFTSVKKVTVVSCTYTGADAERVQRVHLHPLKFGNGCNAPVLKESRVLDDSQ